MTKHCPLYWKKRESKRNQGIKMPDNPTSMMGGQKILVHDGKQVTREEGWVTLRKAAKCNMHNLKGPPTSDGSISNRFDILSQMEEEAKRAR